VKENRKGNGWTRGGEQEGKRLDTWRRTGRETAGHVEENRKRKGWTRGGEQEEKGLDTWRRTGRETAGHVENKESYEMSKLTERPGERQVLGRPERRWTRHRLVVVQRRDEEAEGPRSLSVCYTEHCSSV
jgi:hypothetical protein